MGPKTPTEPHAKSLRRFALNVALLRKDDEADDYGDRFVMENDDAFETLHSLISRARELFGLPQFNDPPDEAA